MARSARCDVRWGAAVFVGSDETPVSENWLCFDAFRRLLLQIGGATITARIARCKHVRWGAEYATLLTDGKH